MVWFQNNVLRYYYIGTYIENKVGVIDSLCFFTYCFYEGTLSFLKKIDIFLHWIDHNLSSSRLLYMKG